MANNQQNFNVPQQPPINPVPPTPKRFSNALIAVMVMVVILSVAVYFVLIRQTKVEPTISNNVQNNQSQTVSNSGNIFKVWDDGTAYVKGEVTDHISGCEVDGACKLIVKTDNQKIALVYAEGDFQCLNTQATSWVNWGENVNKGTVVKAYGAYKKLGSEQRLTFCDSKDYFILGANDPVPVGPYTEKFFDEVAKNKSEVYKNQFEEAQKSGRWETYKNELLGYQFSYPATWSMPQTTPDAPFTIQYHDFSTQNDDWYTITVGFISEVQLSTMGIDYCGAYPNDKRCETKKIGDLVAYIDWGNSDTAFTKIPRPEGGVITLTLKPNSSEAKSFFVSILNTFKFIK